MRPGVPCKPPASTLPGTGAKPVASQKKAPAPPTTQAKRDKPTMAGGKTWAQVVAGGKVAGTTEPKTAPPGKDQRSVEWKVEQMAAQIAMLEKKASKRMAEMEQKMERERAAREEQSAKIDAIFSFIQQSAVAAQPTPAPAARTCAPESGPAQGKREASRRPSEASAWTTVGQGKQEVAPEVGRKRARPQVKKSVLGKQFAKAVEHKRARMRGGL